MSFFETLRQAAPFCTIIVLLLILGAMVLSVRASQRRSARGGCKSNSIEKKTRNKRENL